MSCRIPFSVLAVLGLTVAALAEPGEIKGQDVKDDRDKSALDGWSQAPVPREESAGKDAPDPGGEAKKQDGDRPVPSTGSTDAAGNEPQKPVEHRTPGPSGHSPPESR